jgi:hypothetical protein
MSSLPVPGASISAPQADGSLAGSSNGPPPRGQEPLLNAPQTPECPDSDAFSIEKIAQTYPLPAMDTLSLDYEQTPAGTIKVHQQVRRNGKIKRVPVATPFGVLARLRLVDQANGFGLRVAVQDMCGQKREIDVDRAAFGRRSAEVKALLFNAGLRTEPGGEQIVVQGLKAADPEAEILIVKKPGWHQIEGLGDPVFVCPDGQVLGAPDSCALELARAARLDRTIARGGTFERWKAAIARAMGVRGCEHFSLGVFAGFAGVLVSLAGLDTCGLSLSGLSSSGKTTAQKLAVSAWSRAVNHRRDSLLQSGRTTLNGVESAAAQSAGTILALDELAHIPGKELSNLIYTLAGGVGKRRMATDTSLRESCSWSTFVLLSAEASLAEKIRGDGGEWTAGQAARVPDVDVSGVNRSVDRNIMAEIETIDEHFGHAGPAFVQALIEAGLHRSADELRAEIRERAARIAGPKADSVVIRAAVPFAILEVAGTLACHFGLIPAATNESQIIAWAWERFVQSSDAMALDPVRQVITTIGAYVAERWDTSIQPVAPSESRRPRREAVGWYDADAVYVLAHRLREAAGGSLKEIEVAKVLDAQGLIVKRRDSKSRYVSYVPQIGSVKAYALCRSAFGPTGA